MNHAVKVRSLQPGDAVILWVDGVMQRARVLEAVRKGRQVDLRFDVNGVTVEHSFLKGSTLSLWAAPGSR